MNSLAAPEGAAARDSHRGWIHSPAFDLAFFILSPLAGFALAAAGAARPELLPLLMVGASYLIGVPHYLASFTFFLGEENRAYARGLRWLFYGGPLAIALLVFGLHVAGWSLVVFAVLFVWNIYHVATQSSGILSLYRRLAGGRPDERPWAHRTIVFANAALAFWYIDRFTPLADPMARLHPGLPGAAPYVLLAAALASGALYARAVSRRGFGLSPSESACLVSALLLFTPYLWVQDAQVATLAMLTGHFIQYLAIVWLLNRRRYATTSVARGERWLASTTPTRVLIFMLAVGLAFYGFDKACRGLEATQVFIVAFNTLALVHFYLDGLIWAFRNPYIRRTVGPHLTLEANRIR